MLRDSPSHLVLIGVLGETPRVELGEFKITSDKLSCCALKLHGEAAVDNKVIIS
jgi:hypothetical protein